MIEVFERGKRYKVKLSSLIEKLTLEKYQYIEIDKEDAGKSYGKCWIMNESGITSHIFHNTPLATMQFDVEDIEESDGNYNEPIDTDNVGGLS